MIFIRHGQSEHNAHLTADRDSGLTLLGKQQAHAAARELLSHCLAGYSGLVSPFRRTRETAAIIAEHTGLNFVVWAALRDWTEEVTLDGIHYYHETAEEAQSRCVNAWEVIKGGKYVIVSHQSPVAVFLQLANKTRVNIHDYRHIENCKAYHKL